MSTWTNIGPYGSPTRPIVIDPTHPDTIYTASEGAGIRKSTDGGTTWSPKNNGLPSMVGAYVVAQDPTDPQTLYATGNYVTTDGGEHWTSYTALPRTILAFAGDPNDGTLYAGIAVSPNDTDHLYKSTDHGASWQQADDGIVGEVFRIAVDPLHPGTVFAGNHGTSAGTALGEGLFKTTDGGANWSNVFPSTSGISVALDPSNTEVVYAGNADGVFKSYDGGATWFRPLGFSPDAVVQLVVSPGDPNVLYAATLDGGVFQSTDGAATWHNSGLGTELVLSLAIDPTTSSTVYAGTGTGPYVSHDGGSTWTALDDDLRSTCTCYGVEGLTVDPTNSDAVYAASLTGGGFATGDGGATWSPLTAGLATISPKDITFVPSDPDIVYAASAGQFGPGGVFKSTDGGTNWSRTSLGPSGVYVWSLGLDPNDANTVYAATDARGLFKSTDGGDSWMAINNGLTNINPRVVVVDPDDSDTVYVGTGPNQGGLLQSTDGGNDWSLIGLGGLGINSLSLDPQNSQVIYAGLTASNGLWKSVDGGMNWMNILPNVTVSRSRGILIDPTDSNTVYVGTEGGGVFMSSDGGDTWAAINDGLANLTVYAMAMDPEDPHTLYAGTGRDGVFVLHLDGDAGQPGGIASRAATSHRYPQTGRVPDGHALSVSLLPTDPAGDARVSAPSRDGIHSMPDVTRNAGDAMMQSFGASTTKRSSRAPAASALRHRAHDQFFAGMGGGVYKLGDLLFDDATVIAHNHASDSNDDCFAC
jgi:photosystem II stability/assembly factor-like uncharacterized protein